VQEIKNSNTYLSGSTNLTQQIVTYFQHELRDLDACLLRYTSPIYNKPVLVKRIIKKTGFTEVIKNSRHPLYDKWYDLVSRCFDKNESYSTTRLTFSWRGFCLLGSWVFSTRDKYAWFSFAYTCNLLLGPLPLFPTEAHRQFQLDRIDTTRHYTVDNVRWLSKSDNIANKPPGKANIQDVRFSKTDLVRVMYSIEQTQLQLMQFMSILSHKS
jgi:hypothetical protein